MIPEAQHSIALGREPTIALCVTRILSVLAAVYFDDEASFVTHEVDDEATD